jgi:hypothetical protein
MKYTRNFCLPERGQPYIDAIVLDSRCNQSSNAAFLLAEVKTNACSLDDSGRVCGLTFSTADQDINLDTLNSDCATFNSVYRYSMYSAVAFSLYSDIARCLRSLICRTS